MVKNGIRCGICHAIDRYAKSNNKYMKNFDKNEESSYLNYWEINNLYGWKMSKTLPLGSFKWVKETS